MKFRTSELGGKGWGVCCVKKNVGMRTVLTSGISTFSLLCVAQLRSIAQWLAHNGVMQGLLLIWLLSGAEQHTLDVTALVACRVCAICASFLGC